MEREIIEISQKEMYALLDKPKSSIVDIRETWEFKDFNIGGINIPAHLMNESLPLLKDFEILIIACSNGTRSHILTRLYLRKFPRKEIYHLEEGIY